MNNHTPGPWKIDGGKGKHGDLYIWPDDNNFGGHAIATVHEEIQEGAKGNARLIAAAPEMLEALKKLTDLSYFVGDQRTAAVLAARAAIAKAEGG